MNISYVMPLGRPVRSQIRQNVVEILFYLGNGYGYKIAKIYNDIFPKVTQRSIYYHLRKGIQTKEIEIHKIEEENGNFSWGRLVEKKYYSLGKFALPKGEDKVKEYLKRDNSEKDNKTIPEIKPEIQDAFKQDSFKQDAQEVSSTDKDNSGK